MEMLPEEKFDVFTWIKEPSTIRGIVALAGVLSYGSAKWADADTLAAIIGFAVPAIYAIYNMFRKDSSKK